MASLRRDPSPMRTNDVHLAIGGTLGWGIALVVLLLVDLPGRDRWWVWVCVTGIVIGLFGVWYLPRLHRAQAAAKSVARPAPGDPAAS